MHCIGTQNLLVARQMKVIIKQEIIQKELSTENLKGSLYFKDSVLKVLGDWHTQILHSVSAL